MAHVNTELDVYADGTASNVVELIFIANEYNGNLNWLNDLMVTLIMSINMYFRKPISNRPSVSDNNA